MAAAAWVVMNKQKAQNLARGSMALRVEGCVALHKVKVTRWRDELGALALGASLEPERLAALISEHLGKALTPPAEQRRSCCSDEQEERRGAAGAPAAR